MIGIEPTVVATVVAAVSIAEGAIQVIYKTPDGTIKDRLLGRADEKNSALLCLNAHGPLMEMVNTSSWQLKLSASI